MKRITRIGGTLAVVILVVSGILLERNVRAQGCLAAKYSSNFPWHQGALVQYSFEPSGAGNYKFYLTPDMQTAFANGAQAVVAKKRCP